MVSTPIWVPMYWNRTMPPPAPTRTPTRRDTPPNSEPERRRRLEPERICPAQKEKVIRTVREVPL